MARVALEPKLKVTVLPDLASKSVPIWVNASVSEAAAKTVIGAAGAAGLLGSRSGGLRRLGGAAGDQQQCGDRDQHAADRVGHGVSGISTTTWVDLTDATASTPGSSCRSLAASADISDTTRNGPHCRST